MDGNNMEWTKGGLLRFIELQEMLAEERKSLTGQILEKELVTKWSNKIANTTTGTKKRKRGDEDVDDDSVVMPIYGDDDNVVVVKI
jgi:hypothetical protein